jgi:hypothetical protein
MKLKKAVAEPCEAKALVKDLSECWDQDKALVLSCWCDAQGLTGAASLLRVSTDPALKHADVLRGSVLTSLSLALGLTKPPKPGLNAILVEERAQDKRVAEVLASKKALIDNSIYGKHASEAVREIDYRSAYPEAGKLPALPPAPQHRPASCSPLAPCSPFTPCETCANIAGISQQVGFDRAVADYLKACESAGLPPLPAPHPGLDLVWGPLQPATPAFYAPRHPERTEVMMLGFPPTVIRPGETVHIEAQVCVVSKLLDLAIPDDFDGKFEISSLRVGMTELITTGDPVPASHFKTSYRDREVRELRKLLERAAILEECPLRKQLPPAFFENAPTIQPGATVQVTVENISENTMRLAMSARCLVMTC